MYHVILNTKGTEEAVYITESKEEAQTQCDSLNRLTDGVEMGAYIRTSEELERIATAKDFYNSLTEEEKHDYIEVDGKKYIRKIYEKNNK